MITHYLQHLKRLRKASNSGRLAFEISLILLIKVFLLWLLWSLCFSDPIARDARQLAVTRVLLNQSNQ
jgi:hypothetical protein